MELIETLLEDMERQRKEAEETEEELLKTIANREKLYIEKLEELSKTEQSEELEQNDIEERLKHLENWLGQIFENQKIISEQLKNLSKIFS